MGRRRGEVLRYGRCLETEGVYVNCEALVSDAMTRAMACSFVFEYDPECTHILISGRTGTRQVYHVSGQLLLYQ